MRQQITWLLTDGRNEVPVTGRDGILKALHRILEIDSSVKLKDLRVYTRVERVVLTPGFFWMTKTTPIRL